jgi:hypothetical protein
LPVHVWPADAGVGQLQSHVPGFVGPPLHVPTGHRQSQSFCSTCGGLHLTDAQLQPHVFKPFTTYVLLLLLLLW